MHYVAQSVQGPTMNPIPTATLFLQSPREVALALSRVVASSIHASIYLPETNALITYVVDGFISTVIGILAENCVVPELKRV
jgi:hypothetical protein